MTKFKWGFAIFCVQRGEYMTKTVFRRKIYNEILEWKEKRSDKYSSCIRDKYIIHTKDYKWEQGIHYLPVYMVPFL